MNYSLIDFLTLIGALGLFLYGMKLMSEALQKVAGSKLRNFLAAMTSNRFMGVITGLSITAIIQSSSATTVMIVSFVNAGLLTLTESVGVIMGANVGTTVTAWIISILGFKVKMSVLAFPIIGIGFPLIFSKKTRNQSWGEVLVGFALLFIGLESLKTSVPNIGENPEILEFLKHFTGMGIGSSLIFLVIGTILTVVIQSSSATMALTLVMCNNGWINFDSAAAMVLGENIGTTITANIAAVVANSSAKRAARIHLLFNVVGVILVLTIFPYFLRGVDSITQYFTGSSAFTNTGAVPIALSFFHTSFNILNVLLQIWFVKYLVSLVQKIVPEREDEQEFKLKYIKFGMLSTRELSLLQAKKEIVVYAQHTKKMFGRLTQMLNEENERKILKQFGKVEVGEDKSDEMEVSIAKYLTKVAEGELSKQSSRNISSMLRIVDEIESIGDSCLNIARALLRISDKKEKLTPEMKKKLTEMFALVEKSMDIMIENLNKNNYEVDKTATEAIEKQINRFRDKLRKEHVTDIESDTYSYQLGTLYKDIFSGLERMGDHIYDVTMSIVDYAES
ncbi:Na/Pi cotransporter family protein [Maribellus sp. YY47]|uniref:Na/Pi cotransporter family protein n=1 Tax=Maribellus sp. YY47 TaxID=2929486 RepID=UPI002000ECA0|nr:Na/Pi cotransporter family protein [Maribellus sp. YY47]MCK3684060.1 Na/Pi cotransporter family protein [Maribellus sp. YY47]